VSGPNLDRLGVRQPEVYGTVTLKDIDAMLAARAAELDVVVESVQSNHEGEIVERIGCAKDGGFDGLLLNAGAYSHTSIAILDSILGGGVPCVEVHLSNPEAREEFRHTSMIARACLAKVSGFGAMSYLLALDGLVRHLRQ
jgi:3-dehydroquinate dehydratase-2